MQSALLVILATLHGPVDLLLRVVSLGALAWAVYGFVMWAEGGDWRVLAGTLALAFGASALRLSYGAAVARLRGRSRY